LELSPEAKAAMSRAAEKSYEIRFTIELAAQNLLAAIKHSTPRLQSKLFAPIDQADSLKNFQIR
jgi:hypothetical protein